MEQALRNFLTNRTTLTAWIILVIISLAVLGWDLYRKNSRLMPLMKLVWTLTLAYSGPLGLAIYYYAGRRQIRRDSIWRRGFRSTAHCYSGCGLGEIVGVVFAAGIFAFGNRGIAIITFLLAYVFGYALTVGPLMQGGMALKEAMWDALLTESASITVMEATAIAVDLWFGGRSTIGQALFWSSLFFSLSVGFLAAYPVNLLLIHFGVKEGMGSPKDMHRGP